MPINLLKMPYLVGVGVVAELDYQEIFLLSLCSNRSSFLVRKARIQVPKLAFRYEKCDGHEEFVIEAMTDKGRSYVTSVKHVPKLYLEGVADVKPEHEAALEYWYEDDGSFRHQITRASEPTAVQKEYQDYINYIFHYSGSYKLYLSMKCEGQLPNITNVKYIKIKDGSIDEKFLTNILAMYPNPDTLESSIVRKLPKGSPFFQIQNVAVHSRCGSDYFHNFAGRHMWLDRVTVTEQDIITFLRKWISNEAYQNLEIFIIHVIDSLFVDIDVILQAIEFEEYDPNEPEKRPETYVYDTPISSLFVMEELPLRDEYVVEVKRITDGQRAFLYLDPTHVEFLVQKNQLDDSYYYS